MNRQSPLLAHPWRADLSTARKPPPPSVPETLLERDFPPPEAERKAPPAVRLVTLAVLALVAWLIAIETGIGLYQTGVWLKAWLERG